MNRPEPIELENNLGPDAVTGEINRVPWMAYDVDEMDIYIAEKDAEIAELKQKLEDAKATAYAESVDAGMRERRLRRALWVTRAQRANEHYHRYHGKFLCQLEDIPEYVKLEQVKRKFKWKQVERKCRAKAEEYK